MEEENNQSPSEEGAEKQANSGIGHDDDIRQATPIKFPKLKVSEGKFVFYKTSLTIGGGRVSVSLQKQTIAGINIPDHYIFSASERDVHVDTGFSSRPMIQFLDDKKLNAYIRMLFLDTLRTVKKKQ